MKAILFLQLTLVCIVIVATQRLTDVIPVKGRPNVLFMMSDDLRTDLSIYGRKHVISPNFERLAKRGVVFDRAYNQLAVCFPSRHSLLTSIRPDSTQIHTWTDGQLPYLDGLFSVFVRNGYHSTGIGKLFHHPRNGTSEFPDVITCSDHHDYICQLYQEPR